MTQRGAGRRRVTAWPVIAGCSLFWAAPLAADYQSTMEALTRGLPSEAAGLIYRIVDCNHWGGEEPYDDARKTDIEAAMSRLRCNDLERDVAIARQRYATSPEVLDAIDKAKTLAF